MLISYHDFHFLIKNSLCMSTVSYFGIQTLNDWLPKKLISCTGYLSKPPLEIHVRNVNKSQSIIQPKTESRNLKFFQWKLLPSLDTIVLVIMTSVWTSIAVFKDMKTNSKKLLWSIPSCIPSRLVPQLAPDARGQPWKIWLVLYIQPISFCRLMPFKLKN